MKKMENEKREGGQRVNGLQKENILHLRVKKISFSPPIVTIFPTYFLREILLFLRQYCYAVLAALQLWVILQSHAWETLLG